jgi:hypothetical protein
MDRHQLAAGVVFLALVLSGNPLVGAPNATDTPRANAANLAQRIDQHIAKGYGDRKITPAPLASDAEFLRRIYLDLVGRIPSVEEARRFLKSEVSDKRGQLIDELLSCPNYVNHFANIWRHAILPPSSNPFDEYLAFQLEPWLQGKLRDEVPYNQMVSDLLTNYQKGLFKPNQAMDQGSLTFYQANEFKPENLAASSSRLFLGIRLECAQCHDHPFARWTRNQFWELAAFYVEVQPGTEKPMPPNGKREISIPGTNKVVKARFLDGTEPKLSSSPTWLPGLTKTLVGKEPDLSGYWNARTVLAGWMTSKTNPYFARAIVNRYWSLFFGVGLVEPIDELENEENSASHPELLTELADARVQHNYDLKFLIRAIVLSKTYQRSSVRSANGQDDPKSFARMAIKGLSGEQMFDSLCQATGFREPLEKSERRVVFQVETPRSQFLARFDNLIDKKTEQQTSILQALALMNGKLVADMTSLDRSQTLRALVEDPLLDHRQRLEILYLATLSRPMQAEEASRLVRYVESGGPTKNARKALADVFWVLLNSSEFRLNH